MVRVANPRLSLCVCKVVVYVYECRGMWYEELGVVWVVVMSWCGCVKQVCLNNLKCSFFFFLECFPSSLHGVYLVCRWEVYCVVHVVWCMWW